MGVSSGQGVRALKRTIRSQNSQTNTKSQLNKESEVSADQGVRGLYRTRGSQLNKESGVSIEQRVSAEQEVKGLY